MNRNPSIMGMGQATTPADPYETRRQLVERLKMIDEQLDHEIRAHASASGYSEASSSYGDVRPQNRVPGLKEAGMPPTDDQSARPSFAAEIENTMRGTHETIEALVGEVFRLRSIIAAERDDRFHFEQMILKTLNRMRESGQVPFQTSDSVPHGTPTRY